MLGAGGFIGFNEKTDPIDVAIYLSKYNAIESCGNALLAEKELLA